MPDNSQIGYYSSFVVKIWVAEDGRMSRGRIQHVGTRETTHFVNVDKMMDFVMNHLNPSQNYRVEPADEIDLSMVTLDQEASHEQIQKQP